MAREEHVFRCEHHESSTRQGSTGLRQQLKVELKMNITQQNEPEEQQWNNFPNGPYVFAQKS